ncbi:hypothetical protein [Gemmatimonas groenlandica]|uniref:Uncharacterized protein n=1 Tax=Gemmatimonas groenlandica TaxID=2732249 RepID=A0A6M4IUH7_9BACT|nr:hypothetical protein [Gemmatimonas groenlandica]QJR37156.1 hypothetical protein HKW67_17345 [Gemmatimonas groenlandica]
MSNFLDPQAFPFTEKELRAAVFLLAPGASGEELFHAVLDACASVRSENARATEARLRGSIEPEDINDAVLSLPTELYAALAVSDPTTEQRVEALLAGWRALNRKAWSQQLMPDVLPTLDEAEAQALAEWSSMKARLAATRHKLNTDGPRT